MSVLLVASKQNSNIQKQSLYKGNVVHYAERYSNRVVDTKFVDAFIEKKDYSESVAVIWDAENDTFFEFVYRTSKYPITEIFNHAKVDAPVHVIQRYNKLKEAETKEKEEKEKIEAEKRNFKKGDTVVCIMSYRPANPQNRPMTKGEIGTITWIGNDRFHTGLRLGIKVGPKKEDMVWVNEKKVEKVLS